MLLGYLTLEQNHAGFVCLLHHPDIAYGQNVYGAGEMYITPTGDIKLINDQSGHYQPDGEDFFVYLESLLEEKNISTSGTIYEDINSQFRREFFGKQ